MDLSNYFGFGERFDRLDHVHSILKNETRNTVGVKGNDTYKPVPFFMSLRGYGLWVDTYSDATFDLNVTDASAHSHRCPRGRSCVSCCSKGRVPHHSGPLHRAGRTRATASLLGLRSMESARLPSQPPGSQ